MSRNKDVTVTMPEDLVQEIDENLDYGDSRSEWIRQAVLERLEESSREGNPKAAPLTS